MALSLAWSTANSGATAAADDDNEITIDLGTVATNDIIVLMCSGTWAATQATNNWQAPTKSSGTATIGTVTEILEEKPSGTNLVSLAIWWFEATAGGTLTMQTDEATNRNNFGWGVIGVVATGADTTTPITGLTSGSSSTDNNDPANGTLGAAPVSGDYSIAVINWDTDAESGKGVTPGSGWTEGAEIGTTSDFVQMQASYRTGSTSTAVDWPDSDDTPTRYSDAQGAFNLKAAAGGQTISPSATTVTATAGTLQLDMNVALAGPTVTATAGTAQVDMTVAPGAVTVTATVGTLTVTPGAVNITPSATTVTASAGTLQLDMAVALAGPTVTSTPGTLTVDMNVAPSATTVTASPGTLTVTVGGAQSIDPSATTVTATAGTLTVDMAVAPAGPTITATAGTAQVDMAVAPGGPTVTVTAGTLTLDLAVSLAGPTVTSSSGTLTITTGAVNIAPDSGFDEGFDPPGFGQGTTVTVTAGTVSVSLGVSTRPSRIDPAQPIDRIAAAVEIDQIGPAQLIDTLADAALVDA